MKGGRGGIVLPVPFRFREWELRSSNYKTGSVKLQASDFPV